MTLSIDIETYSSTDLVKTNVYKYVEAEDFDVLLIGLRYDDGPVRVIDTHDKTPLLGLRQLMADLVDPTVVKTAYNAQFEIVCLSRYFNLVLDPAQWRCTMAGAARLGLPFGLDKVAEVLGLGTKKDTRGRALIKYFSVPCKPTAINGGRVRNLPHHAPDKWDQFIEYCRKDVEVETAIKKIISFYDVPGFERPMFALDQAINSRGVLVDLVLVRAAIKINDAYTERMIAEAVKITGLANPNSVAQLRGWLERQTGDQVEDLRKENIPAMIAAAGEWNVRRVLQIRQLISKSSIKKYYAMLNGASADGRVRGLFQYYGANRTGRWAGRQVQMQNLIKNSMPDLDLARALVRAGDLDTLELVYGSVPGVLSQLIRTAFVPSEGKVLLVSDFSAIEARVIAWLAGEEWRLGVFRGGGKIYEASAATMFFVPLEEVTREMRAKGKIAELALGYQGGVGALLKMGALAMGLVEDELPGIVERWRSANNRIVGIWQRAENAARSAVADPGRVVVCGRVAYQVRQDILFCRLPSGRELAYMRPRVEAGKFGYAQVTYEGMNQTTKKWGRSAAYGGLLVENMTQAIARDILAEKIKICEAADLFVTFHVHDEIVVEAPKNFNLNIMDEIMARPVPWAEGLPLAAESFKTNYYKKD